MSTLSPKTHLSRNIPLFKDAEVLFQHKCCSELAYRESDKNLLEVMFHQDYPQMYKRIITKRPPTL